MKNNKKKKTHFTEHIAFVFFCIRTSATTYLIVELVDLLVLEELDGYVELDKETSQVGALLQVG